MNRYLLRKEILDLVLFLRMTVLTKSCIMTFRIDAISLFSSIFSVGLTFPVYLHLFTEKRIESIIVNCLTIHEKRNIRKQEGHENYTIYNKSLIL